MFFQVECCCHEKPPMALPNELQHLQNLIDAARENTAVAVLRDFVKAGVDEAPADAVVRFAELMLTMGIEIEQRELN